MDAITGYQLLQIQRQLLYLWLIVWGSKIYLALFHFLVKLHEIYFNFYTIFLCSNESTWEPQDNLECPDLIEAYEKKIREKEALKRKSAQNVAAGDVAAKKRRKEEAAATEKRKDTSVSCLNKLSFQIE